MALQISIIHQHQFRAFVNVKVKLGREAVDALRDCRLALCDRRGGFAQIVYIRAKRHYFVYKPPDFRSDDGQRRNKPAGQRHQRFHPVIARLFPLVSWGLNVGEQVESRTSEAVSARRCHRVPRPCLSVVMATHKSPAARRVSACTCSDRHGQGGFGCRCRQNERSVRILAARPFQTWGWHGWAGYGRPGERAEVAGRSGWTGRGGTACCSAATVGLRLAAARTMPPQV
jgi:hypothetical protein